MFRAVVKCPKCNNVQKYENHDIRKLTDFYIKNKLTTCKNCRRNFKIKGPEANRILSVGWNYYEELRKKYTPNVKFDGFLRASDCD